MAAILSSVSFICPIVYTMQVLVKSSCPVLHRFIYIYQIKCVYFKVVVAIKSAGINSVESRVRQGGYMTNLFKPQGVLGLDGCRNSRTSWRWCDKIQGIFPYLLILLAWYHKIKRERDLFYYK